ncbi:DUF4190 domain-containing protein [Lysobacter avium]|uniref:DUF4190 domain-containing protein n=2 Tax=Lysobacterales TaxID=135614 RepID=A0A7S6ZW70_9GAMM|nr:DUF4190 domain-containing protein [Lysobacter avium]QOW25413.1 DUF4190 domain-containing protein [Lysobacter sp. H23M47]
MNTSVSAPLPPPTHQVRRTSSMAVISLVAGILGWTLLPFVASIVAIVTGHMARSEIKAANGLVDGDGLAVSGLVLGYAMVALAIVSIIGVLLLFGGLAAFLALASNWG